MKRIALLSLVVALIVSLAAPMGAVFATDDVPIEPASSVEIIEPESTDTLDVAPTFSEAPVTPESSQPISLKATEPRIEMPPPPVEPPSLPPQRKVYVSAFQTTNALGFVELYNSDTKTQSINSWRFVADFGDGLLCEVQLSGYILPKTKVLLLREGTLDDTNAFEFGCGEASRVLKSLTMHDGDQVIEKLEPPSTDDQIWARRNTTSTYTTGTFSQDFIGDTDSKFYNSNNKEYTITDGYWYIPPPAPSAQILEVYVSPRSCIVPDDSATCYDYIKIKNTSDTEPLDLGNYRLRSGYSNSASSSSNTTYSSIVLEPDEVRTLTHDQYGARVSFTANDGTVWFEDVEGVITYPTNVPPYVGSNLAAQTGRSWAYNNRTGTWQWATPSPYKVDNDFTVPEPGKGSGAASRQLVPCREGQYRSEETNRCRSIVSAAASVLKPCADDQFRNPATNRCKKIASSDDIALADCGEGRERNPATNRCRNVKRSVPPAAGFAVEPIRDSASVFIGWWVLGGITLVAVGYAGWEWREEIGRVTRKVFRPGKSMK